MLMILKPKSKYLEQSKVFELFGSQKSLVMHLKLLKHKILTCNLPLFHILQTYVYLHCLSQKHGDDQFLHDFVTTYNLCVNMNNFTDYNTHLFTNYWYVNAFGPENKNGYTACHHHQGQNRPHQKTITYPHGPHSACNRRCSISGWE